MPTNAACVEQSPEVLIPHTPVCRGVNGSLDVCEGRLAPASRLESDAIDIHRSEVFTLQETRSGADGEVVIRRLPTEVL